MFLFVIPLSERTSRMYIGIKMTPGRTHVIVVNIAIFLCHDLPGPLDLISPLLRNQIVKNINPIPKVIPYFRTENLIKIARFLNIVTCLRQILIQIQLIFFPGLHLSRKLDSGLVHDQVKTANQLRPKSLAMFC